MDDRELLELAAKAAGYDTSHPWNAERLTLDPPVIGLCIDGVSTRWDPLDNDGDALRLAVKRGIHLQFSMNYVVTYAGSVHAKQFTERISDDECAATRRAIVRAAAEIGKGME